jgi:hypothetical protein
MARVVESVAAGYADSVRWEKVITKTMEGARRWQQLSKELGRPAPVPSIFINGNMAFHSTPGPEELKAYLDHLAGSAQQGVENCTSGPQARRASPME